MLIPRQAVPGLTLPTLAHGMFDLSAEQPDTFSLLVAYRGLHCPVVRSKDHRGWKQKARGCGIVALLSDKRSRAQ